MLNAHEKRWLSGVGALVVTGLVAACGGDSGAQTRAESDSMVAQRTSATQPVAESTARRGGPEPSEAPEPEEPVVRNVTYSDAESVFHAGRYADAMELFGAYVESHPENGWGHYMLGLSAWKAGDHGRAEEALLRVVELDGKNVKGHTNIARVLLDQGRPEDALAHLEVVVELDGESADAWRVLGNAQSDLGRNEEALDSYRQALLLNEEDAWSMNNYGFLLIQLGRYETAVPPLARAVELRPESPTFQNNLGIAFERAGELGGAQAAFAAAVEADSTYRKAAVSRDRVEERIGDAQPESPDVSALAQVFVEEMEGWRVSATAELTPH